MRETLRQAPWALGFLGLVAACFGATVGLVLGAEWLLVHTWLGEAALAVAMWTGTPVVIFAVFFVLVVAYFRADFVRANGRQVHAASMHGTSCSCGISGCTGRKPWAERHDR